MDMGNYFAHPRPPSVSGMKMRLRIKKIWAQAMKRCLQVKTVHLKSKEQKVQKTLHKIFVTCCHLLILNLFIYQNHFSLFSINFS